MNIFGKLRKEKGLTQIELAQKFNIRQTTVSSWENNISMPDYQILIKLADYFEVSIDYLLGREDDCGAKTYENSGQITDRLESSDDIEREAIAILRRYPPEYKKHALVALENDLDTIIEVKKSLRTNF